MQEPPLIARARRHHQRPAIVAAGREFLYQELLEASGHFAEILLENGADLAEARIAFLAPAGFEYLAIQWAIWRAGGIAVPLSLAATPPELQHVLGDCLPSAVVVAGEAPAGWAERCRGQGIRLLTFEATTSAEAGFTLPSIDPDRGALILYTSGTTSRPKGVVLTHANLQAQIEALVTAWEWRESDRIPLFLPMHHIHGIVNIACCALWSGATLETFPRFEAATILARVAAGAYTLFMAVPTVYVKLIELLSTDPGAGAALAGFAAMRLMVSGSAALPPSVHHRWRSLTGQILLERYGMTETGMTLSNPLHGERRPGTVGQPLPGVEIRLQGEDGELATLGEPGEIQVRGAVVFREYWNRPEATAESRIDGWFRTGDLAVMEAGYCRILGRLSADIIKSGGYKLSALEIEAALLEHPSIRECAVVGVDDATWGERVAAAVVLEPGAAPLTLDDLLAWSRDRLSAYKLPRSLAIVDHLPRNAMGKVTKQDVRKRFEGEERS